MTWIIACFCVSVIAGCHWLAGVVAARPESEQQRWASLGGGAGIAYVFLHLMPELAIGGKTLSEAQGMQTFATTPVIEALLFLVALIGVTFFFQHGRHFLPEQKKQLNGRLGTRTCLRLDQLLVLLHPPLTNHHRPLIWPTVHGRDFSARAFGGSNDGSPSPAGISTSISLVRHSSRCRGIHSCGSTASDLGSHSCHRDSLPWRRVVDLSVPRRASLTFLYELMVVSQRTRHDVYSAVEGSQPLPSLNRSVEDSLKRSRYKLKLTNLVAAFALTHNYCHS